MIYFSEFFVTIIYTNMKLIRTIDPNSFFPTVSVLGDDGKLSISFNMMKISGTDSENNTSREEQIELILLPYNDSHPTEVAFIREQLLNEIQPESYTLHNGELISEKESQYRILNIIADRKLRTESIYIGTKQQIIDMIESDPKKYRPTGTLTLNEQLDKICVESHSKMGAVFMLGLYPKGRQNVDKWWVRVENQADEAKKILVTH